MMTNDDYGRIHSVEHLEHLRSLKFSGAYIAYMFFEHVSNRSFDGMTNST